MANKQQFKGRQPAKLAKAALKSPKGGGKGMPNKSTSFPGSEASAQPQRQNYGKRSI